MVTAERVRVRVSEEAKERFEKFAKGVFLAHGDRESLLQGKYFRSDKFYTIQTLGNQSKLLFGYGTAYDFQYL